MIEKPELCPTCAAKKSARQVLCWSCWHRLPEKLIQQWSDCRFFTASPERRTELRRQMYVAVRRSIEQEEEEERGKDQRAMEHVRQIETGYIYRTGIVGRKERGRHG